MSVVPREVQAGSRGACLSTSVAPVSPREVKAERRDPDEAERIDWEAASRIDCAPARDADDGLLDFLRTTLVVSVPSSLSAAASP